MARTKAKDAAEMTKAERREQKMKSLKLQLGKDGMDKERLKLVMGLIERVSFAEVELEDMERDIEKNGYTEKFQQGRDQTPYDRERPIAKLYLMAQGKYKDMMAALVGMLPKNDGKGKVEDDKLDEFIRSRKN